MYVTLLFTFMPLFDQNKDWKHCLINFAMDNLETNNQKKFLTNYFLFLSWNT